jgi:(+)-pinoresinol hydroxylase
MTSIKIFEKLISKCLVLVFLLAVTQVQAEQEPGEVVYQKWCDGCHMDSPFAPGTIQLRHLRGNDLALVLNRKDLKPDFLRHIIRKGMNGMPLFRRTEISDKELEKLVEFLVRK